MLERPAIDHGARARAPEQRPSPTLTEAIDPPDFAVAGELFKEYATQLSIDLCFQGFEAELARLPQTYGPPFGCLLLARDGDGPVGCGALRRLDADACEMKRLYVRPQARGASLGRTLAERLVAKARSIGYARIYLDTLKEMVAAQGLYRSLGFCETAPYYQNPSSEAVYMVLNLAMSTA